MPITSHRPNYAWREDRPRKPIVRKSDDAFYSLTHWRNLRMMFLRRNPWCAECKKLGYLVAAVEVDHVTKRTDRPDLELDESNLQGLCKSCHSRKTMIERHAHGT